MEKRLPNITHTHLIAAHVTALTRLYIRKNSAEYHRVVSNPTDNNAEFVSKDK